MVLLADITGSLWCSLSEDLRDLVHTVLLADITGSLQCYWQTSQGHYGVH